MFSLRVVHIFHSALLLVIRGYKFLRAKTGDSPFFYAGAVRGRRISVCMLFPVRTRLSAYLGGFTFLFTICQMFILIPRIAMCERCLGGGRWSFPDLLSVRESSST
jgi:hypothetical protein